MMGRERGREDREEVVLDEVGEAQGMQWLLGQVGDDIGGVAGTVAVMVMLSVSVFGVLQGRRGPRTVGIEGSSGRGDEPQRPRDGVSHAGMLRKPDAGLFEDDAGRGRSELPFAVVVAQIVGTRQTRAGSWGLDWTRVGAGNILNY